MPAPAEASLLHELLLAWAPVFRSMGLVVVFVGGITLNHARRPRDRPLARRRGNRSWRLFGHAMIGLGLATVLVGAAYFPFLGSTAFGEWYAPEIDGVAILLRFVAFLLVVVGGAFVWGGKKLVDGADPSPASIDMLLRRVVCGVGYLFIICGVMLVTIAGTKLSFSAQYSVPEIEKCLREMPGVGLGCYFVSLL